MAAYMMLFLLSNLMFYFLEFVGNANAQATLTMIFEEQPVVSGQDVLLVGGEDYTFQCVHSTSADITWELGGRQRTADSEDRLTLRNVYLECGLVLECFSGVLSVTVIIKIIVAPDQLVISEQNQGTIPNGGRAIINQDKAYTFICEANGINPEAEFNWYIDGNLLLTTLAVWDETVCSLMDSNDEFSITADYEVHQDKILQCRASNEADPVGKTIDVILDVTVHPESVDILKDGFSIADGGKLQITAQVETTVTCEVTGARPAASIEWFLDGTNETTFAVQSSSIDGGLEDTLSDLTLTFGSNFCNKNLRCVGLHPATGTEMETSVTLDILVPPAKPTISLVGGASLADDGTVSITQNDTYVFQCSSEGAIPAVDFQWILGTDVEDTYISPNENTNCLPTFGSFTYTLTANHVKHHVEYIKCLVKNEANTDGVSTRVKLVVDALIGFQNTKITISESEPEVVVSLVRVGPLDATPSARLSLSSRSTATLGKDFRSTSLLPVRVEFERDKETLDVVFLLEDDEDFELTETLILELDMPENSKIIRGQDEVVISITDSGGIPKCTSDETGVYTGCKDLDTLSQFHVSDENVVMVAETLAGLTEGIPPGEATIEDTNSLAKTLENIVNVENGDIKVTTACVAAVDNLINGLKQVESNTSIEHSRKTPQHHVSNSTSMIVQSLQRQVSLTLSKEGSVRIIKPNVACEGVVATDPNVGIGIVILKDGASMGIDRITEGQTQALGDLNSSSVNDESMLVSSTPLPMEPEEVQFTNDSVLVFHSFEKLPESRGLLYVPQDFVEEAMGKDGNSTLIVFICYANPVFFHHEDKDEFIDSIVVSATINSDVFTRPKPTTSESILSPDALMFNTSEVSRKSTGSVGEPITIQVTTAKMVAKQGDRCIKETHPVVHQCVFWDFKLEQGKGGWSREGCWVNRTKNNEVTCHCDHLTNFAVLASYQDMENDVVDWISAIGCYVTIGLLGISLLIFVLLKESRKVLASKAPRQVLFQFCISVLLLYTCFIVFIDRACPVIYCEIGAILLHYFILSSMIWMGVHSRYLYHKLVNVLYMDYTWFIYVATLISWGVPLIPIVPTVVLSYDSYQNDKYCFLVPGWVFYFGLLLPIALIIFHNFISFIIISNRLCRRKLPNTGDPERVHYKQQFQNGFALTILLGLTWTSAYFAIDIYTSLITSIVFAVICSLQGLFVFVLFCLRQPDVRRFCKCCRSPERNLNRQRSYDADWEPSHINPKGRNLDLRRRSSHDADWAPSPSHINPTYEH